MSNFAIKIKKIILLIGDIAVLYVSLWLTLLIRYGEIPSYERWDLHFLPFTIIFIVWLIIFYILGLYELGLARNNITFWGLLLKSFAWAAVISLAYFYLLRPGIAPKRNLFLDLFISLALFSFWRQFFNLLIKKEAFLINTLIIGVNDKSIKLAQEIILKPQAGFRLLGMIDETGSSYIPLLPQVEIVRPPYNLKEILVSRKIKTIITAFNPQEYPNLIRKLYQCLSLKVSLVDLTQFLEKFTGKIPVDTIGQIWFLENLKESEKEIYETVKRIIDFVLASILFFASIPFLPIIYLTIKLDNPGSAFFTQHRIGKGGKKFLAMKFRSMYKDAESHGPQWAEENDQRVTRVGRILRKTRIDEMPQLINVLAGEMSFIGPRPERPEFVEKLKKNIPFYDERHLVKPGLTGWAQINFPYGSSEKDALEKLQYDLYYIKNRSLILDFSILLKTVKIILSGQGR